MAYWFVSVNLGLLTLCLIKVTSLIHCSTPIYYGHQFFVYFFLQEQPALPVGAQTHGSSVISTELKRNVLTVQNTVLRLAAKKARTLPVTSRKYL